MGGTNAYLLKMTAFLTGGAPRSPTETFTPASGRVTLMFLRAHRPLVIYPPQNQSAVPNHVAEGMGESSLPPNDISHPLSWSDSAGHSGTRQHDGLDTTATALPWLSSGPVPSPFDCASVSSRENMIDDFDLRGLTSAPHEDPHRPVLAEPDPAQLIFPSTMGVEWSDFMDPDYLTSSEPTGIPSPDLIPSAWPESPPLLDFSPDGQVRMEHTCEDEPQQLDFIMSSCTEQDSIEAVTEMPISKGWVSLLLISYLYPNSLYL